MKIGTPRANVEENILTARGSARYISVMNSATKLSAEQSSRVFREISECERKIAREKAFSPDLQNTARIAQLDDHIQHLHGLLKNGLAVSP